MSLLNSSSKRSASLLSVIVVASALLAPAAIAAPYSAGNSFEIPRVTHSLGTRLVARHQLPSERWSAGNSFEIPLTARGTAKASLIKPMHRTFSAGNSFEIPVDGRM